MSLQRLLGGGPADEHACCEPCSIAEERLRLVWRLSALIFLATQVLTFPSTQDQRQSRMEQSAKNRRTDSSLEEVDSRLSDLEANAVHCDDMKEYSTTSQLDRRYPSFEALPRLVLSIVREAVRTGQLSVCRLSFCTSDPSRLILSQPSMGH